MELLSLPKLREWYSWKTLSALNPTDCIATPLQLPTLVCEDSVRLEPIGD